MGDGIIEFCFITLSDAHILFVSAGNEYLARRECDGKAVIVSEGGIDEMPFAILIVLQRRCRYEVGGMPTNHRHLAIQHDDRVPAAWDVQVWQSLHLHLLDCASIGGTDAL